MEHFNNPIMQLEKKTYRCNIENSYKMFGLGQAVHVFPILVSNALHRQFDMWATLCLLLSDIMIVIK